MTKRIMTAILTIICILSLVPTIVYAADLGPSNLTVIMDYGTTPLPGIDVSVCQVADAAVDASGNVTFTATQAFSGAGADFTNLDDEKNVALAASLDAYASANNIARIDQVTDSNGQSAFTGLSAGLYLVAQKSGDNSGYIIAPYLVMVPNTDSAARGGWNYNVISYPKTEPSKIDITTTSISVYKIWQGTDSHPDSVSVQLYQNGKPYGDAVSLNAGDYWRYAWDNLDAGSTWTVDELDVPADYTKTVSGNMSNGFIITNTYTPNTPGTSSMPSYPVPTTGYTPTNTPKTGDDSNMPLWIWLVIAGSIGLVGVICVLNSKRLIRIFTRK